MDGKIFENIDDYINAFQGEARRILEKIRKTVREAAPDAIETISYGMPTFKLFGNLVHFAAYKNHIGFYPTPSGMEEFKKEVDTYKSGKGTMQFPLNKPIPYELITAITKYRALENKAKASKKRK